MDCVNELNALEPIVIIRAALNMSFWYYVLGLVLIMGYVVYNFVEIHLIGDLLFGIGRNSVRVICDPASEIATQVLSKCQILRGRYWPTPWLCSPHLQTAFLHFFGNPPVFEYQRQIFLSLDGETIALDWLIDNDIVKRPASLNMPISENNSTPIVIVIPGLTSDSKDPYIKHIAYALAKNGWKMVVVNHRGLGGTSVNTGRFYNAGWTEDLRRVIGYLRDENPKAPLLAVGTSIGANILVKYLGEEGANTPLVGATAICCPWDLVIGDRFINRRLIQRIYNKVLATGLRGYAQMHQGAHAQIADWDCIEKTVDTYYRSCSSAYFVSNVSVPLLCINALDDPVCTREAIPWDECRLNKNVVLATTSHGGHLAYFEGLRAGSIWWVRAAKEFLSVLYSSSLMHSGKKTPDPGSTLSSPFDKGPYLNVTHDGMVSTHDSSFMQIQKDGEDIREEEVYIFSESPAKLLDNDKKTRIELDTYQSVKESKLANSSSEEESKLGKGSNKEESKLANGSNEEKSDQKHSDEERGPIFKICMKDGKEYIALQSALQQLLEQMQASSKGEAMSNAVTRSPQSNVLSQSGVPEEPVHTSPSNHLPLCNSDTGGCSNVESGSPIKESVQKQKGGDDEAKTTISIAKRMMHISRSQRWSIWILAYMALVTAWPLLGSALMLNLRKRFKSVWSMAGSRK
ncbi:uncharacterized protein LOC131067217 isoform X2 [Cryptomeria japonica]|uniref:uncharacterized protein LOC131067217 isoform X2 n=1 Tax=Cryptomeria japonica TaxID=3369 RepID=UPI0025AD4F8E|nr:uncharacterized protein LOC131067217 isoform X2 [Cryptomeria japonica]